MICAWVRKNGSGTARHETSTVGDRQAKRQSNRKISKHRCRHHGAGEAPGSVGVREPGRIERSPQSDHDSRRSMRQQRRKRPLANPTHAIVTCLFRWGANLRLMKGKSMSKFRQMHALVALVLGGFAGTGRLGGCRGPHCGRDL